MTAVVAFAILAMQTRGYRRFELAIAALLGIVLLGFAYDLAQVGVDTGELPRAASCRTSRAPTRSCSPSASSARP